MLPSPNAPPDAAIRQIDRMRGDVVDGGELIVARGRAGHGHDAARGCRHAAFRRRVTSAGLAVCDCGAPPNSFSRKVGCRRPGGAAATTVRPLRLCRAASRAERRTAAHSGSIHVDSGSPTIHPDDAAARASPGRVLAKLDDGRRRGALSAAAPRRTRIPRTARRKGVFYNEACAQTQGGYPRNRRGVRGGFQFSERRGGKAGIRRPRAAGVAGQRERTDQAVADRTVAPVGRGAAWRASAAAANARGAQIDQNKRQRGLQRRPLATAFGALATAGAARHWSAERNSGQSPGASEQLNASALAPGTVLGKKVQRQSTMIERKD